MVRKKKIKHFRFNKKDTPSPLTELEKCFSICLWLNPSISESKMESHLISLIAIHIPLTRLHTHWDTEARVTAFPSLLVNYPS